MQGCPRSQQATKIQAQSLATWLYRQIALKSTSECLSLHLGPCHQERAVQQTLMEAALLMGTAEDQELADMGVGVWSWVLGESGPKIDLHSQL